MTHKKIYLVYGVYLVGLSLATGYAYAQKTPIFTGKVTPNVNFVLDSSGPMNFYYSPSCTATNTCYFDAGSADEEPSSSKECYDFCFTKKSEAEIADCLFNNKEAHQSSPADGVSRLKLLIDGLHSFTNGNPGISYGITLAPWDLTMKDLASSANNGYNEGCTYDASFNNFNEYPGCTNHYEYNSSDSTEGTLCLSDIKYAYNVLSSKQSPYVYPIVNDSSFSSSKMLSDIDNLLGYEVDGNGDDVSFSKTKLVNSYKYRLSKTYYDDFAKNGCMSSGSLARKDLVSAFFAAYDQWRISIQGSVGDNPYTSSAYPLALNTSGGSLYQYDTSKKKYPDIYGDYSRECRPRVNVVVLAGGLEASGSPDPDAEFSFDKKECLQPQPFTGKYYNGSSVVDAKYDGTWNWVSRIYNLPKELGIVSSRDTNGNNIYSPIKSYVLGFNVVGTADFSSYSCDCSTGLMDSILNETKDNGRINEPVATLCGIACAGQCGLTYKEASDAYLKDPAGFRKYIERRCPGLASYTFPDTSTYNVATSVFNAANKTDFYNQLSNILNSTYNGDYLSTAPTFGPDDKAYVSAVRIPDSLGATENNYQQWSGHVSAFQLDTLGTLKNCKSVATASASNGQCKADGFIWNSADRFLSSACKSDPSSVSCRPFIYSAKAPFLTSPSTTAFSAQYSFAKDDRVLFQSDKISDGDIIADGQHLNVNPAQSSSPTEGYIACSLIKAGDTITTNTQALIQFVRGDTDVEYYGYCEPASIKKRENLPILDILNSQPRYIRQPMKASIDKSYIAFSKDNSYRNEFLLAGSNTGMIHGFLAGVYDTTAKKWVRTPSGTYDFLGGEYWGYVPRHLLPKFKTWWGNEGHPLFVNASPAVNDVYTNTAFDTASCTTVEASTGLFSNRQWRTMTVIGDGITETSKSPKSVGGYSSVFDQVTHCKNFINHIQERSGFTNAASYNTPWGCGWYTALDLTDKANLNTSDTASSAPVAPMWEFMGDGDILEAISKPAYTDIYINMANIVAGNSSDNPLVAASDATKSCWSAISSSDPKTHACTTKSTTPVEKHSVVAFGGKGFATSDFTDEDMGDYKDSIDEIWEGNKTPSGTPLSTCSSPVYIVDSGRGCLVAKVLLPYSYGGGSKKCDMNKGSDGSNNGGKYHGIRGQILPVDINMDSASDYLYVGDRDGNIYRIDVTSTDSSKWTKSSSYTSVTNLVQNNWKGNLPITFSVAASYDGSGGVYLFAGTGDPELLASASGTSLPNGEFYFIHDEPVPGQSGTAEFITEVENGILKLDGDADPTTGEVLAGDPIVSNYAVYFMTYERKSNACSGNVVRIYGYDYNTGEGTLNINGTYSKSYTITSGESGTASSGIPTGFTYNHGQLYLAFNNKIYNVSTRDMDSSNQVSTQRRLYSYGWAEVAGAPQ